jgi:3-deoxy-7-phosphoheptulonate synthase
MVIILKPDTSSQSPELAQVLAEAAKYPQIKAQTHESKGETRTLIEVHLIGPTQTVPVEPFQSLAAVERVVRVSEKYRSIGRHKGQAPGFKFEYNGVAFGQETFHIFSGLCAVDNREHVEETMRALKDNGIVTTRMGAYKPRTSPYEFQGHGAACLPYVFELAGKYGVRVIAMEVTHESHIAQIKAALASTGNATGVMLQVGTRNAQNFELLKAVGAENMPVLYKRGMGITLEESLNACEYIAACGNRNIVFGLRGMKTNFGDPHRNFVDFAHVPVVRRLTRLPVCIDPSHSVGRKDENVDGISDIHHVTAQGIIAGANMVLVDVHPHPEKALCDGPQALSLRELPGFLADTRLVRETYEKRVALHRAA